MGFCTLLWNPVKYSCLSSERLFNTSKPSPQISSHTGAAPMGGEQEKGIKVSGEMLCRIPVTCHRVGCGEEKGPLEGTGHSGSGTSTRERNLVRRKGKYDSSRTCGARRGSPKAPSQAEHRCFSLPSSPFPFSGSERALAG